ncbi:cholesterol 7-desaturase nvd-like [Rhineura floridana]|uniref:cholesterol 7-desaturase nvd-like n=1 Tax=Rhineura floridana TaxID=261503 RepID=UPI002AC85E0B|nr:cholesterol 7-desaturase nvd-like [Rhineura floridana]
MTTTVQVAGPRQQRQWGGTRARSSRSSDDGGPDRRNCLVAPEEPIPGGSPPPALQGACPAEARLPSAARAAAEPCAGSGWAGGESCRGRRARPIAARPQPGRGYNPEGRWRRRFLREGAMGPAALLLGSVAGAAVLLLLLGEGSPALPSGLLPLLLWAVGGGAAWLALRPLRIRRALDSVGYLPEAGWSRAQAAHRVRRSRRIGQLPPVYPNGWFRLLQSAQLAVGEVRNVAALGEQFAVFRDADGKAHVVDAYCPHLGANLAIGGRVVGSCIECPFHGWQFHGANGKCTRIPYAEKVPEFAKIKVWPSCEASDMIFVWYHCDGIDPTWQVPKQEDLLPQRCVFRGITEHFVSAHIQEIPENAADVAHLAFLHGPWFMNGVDLQYTKSNLWTFFEHQWQAEWQPDPEPNTHCSFLHLNHRLTIFGKHFRLMDLSVSAKQVGPALVFLIFKHRFLGQGILIQSITPLEPLLQHVVHQMYYQKNVPAFIPKFMLWAESLQFERDIMIWNNKQHLSRPLLVKEDATIQRHRRWFAQFYSEKSVKFTSRKESLDW